MVPGQSPYHSSGFLTPPSFRVPHFSVRFRTSESAFATNITRFLGLPEELDFDTDATHIRASLQGAFVLPVW